MLDEMVKDYSAYFKLDIADGYQAVQDVIDNMLTRLEELTSVLQMIKLKNGDCSQAVTKDINNFRLDITALSKKVSTLNEVVIKLHSNIELLERQVERAELDFGMTTDNKIKSFLLPLLKRNRESAPAPVRSVQPVKIQYESVLDSFTEKESG